MLFRSNFQRLKKYTAKAAQFPYQLVQFRIFPHRQMLGILKGGIEVELEADADDAARPIFHIERIVIETDLAQADHLPQGLLAGEGSFKRKRNRHGQSLIIEHPFKLTA